MKRVLTIFMVFLPFLTATAQEEIRVSIMEVDDQIYFRGDTLGDYILDLVSGSLITASNGLTKDVQDIKLGGTLTENTTVTGGGYNIIFGTSSSRLNNFNVYSNTGINLNADGGSFTVTADGNQWYIEDEYLKVQRLGSTDTIISAREVREMISNAQPFLPFNYSYSYSSLTENSRPGSGYFRLDNATYSSVTQIYMDAFDLGAIDISDFIMVADTGAYISISNGTGYINYKINGPVSDSGNYVTYNVDYVNGNGTISGICAISVDMSRIGSGNIIVDTANYARASDEYILYNVYDDTTLSYGYHHNLKFNVYPSSETDTIIISLPDIAYLDTSENIKELQFVLVDTGTVIFDPYSSQTINGELLDNINKTFSAFTIFPSSSTNWTIGQDSRDYIGGAVRFVYDTLNKIGEMSIIDENPETSLQIGYELWVPPSCYNGTASTITNGSVVYIDTSNQGYPSIELADNRYYNTSRIIGVATHDIEAYAFGTVTSYGYVNNVPSMAGRETNVAYIGQNGNKVYSRPTGGNYPGRVGYVINDTTLFVNICPAEYTDEMVKAFGFHDYSNTYTALDFDNSTRYAKITPVGSNFFYYQNGTKYIHWEADSIQIDADEGAYVVYYDTDTLNFVHDPNDAEIIDIIKNKVLVMMIYWDATNSEAVVLNDERHTFHMDVYERLFLDFVITCRWGGDGLAINNITTDGDGDYDTVAQFDITSGNLFNEDIYSITPSIQRGDNIPIYYLSGGDLYFRRIYEPGFPVLTDITAGINTTGRLVYNDTETGSLLTVTSNDFVLCHIFASVATEDTNKVIAVVGQETYGSISDAQNGALIEGKSLKSNILFKRNFAYLYTMIYQTSDSYGNSVKARVVSALDDLGNSVDYIDWRSGAYGSGGVAGSGAGSFLDLTDSPSNYTGNANNLVSVNGSETALEFIPNDYKDSSGVVSIIYNTSLDSIDAFKIKTSNIEVDSILRIGTGDTLWFGSKSDEDATFMTKGSGSNEPTYWRDASGDYIAMNVDGGETVNIYSPMINLASSSSGLFTVAGNAVEWYGTDFKFYTTGYDEIGYISTTNEKLHIKEVDVTEVYSDTAHILDLNADTAIIDTLYADKANLDTASIRFANIDTAYVDTVYSDMINVDTLNVIKSNIDTSIVKGRAGFDGEIEVLFFQETYSSSKTIDFTDGNAANRYIVLTGNITINVTLPYGTSTVEIVQDASGSHTITVGTGWGTKFNTLDFDTGSNASTIVQFIKSPIGTKYFIGINQN